MREPLFVKQNAKKWAQFEQATKHTPDELAESFIQITDDLAYAKTFYPKSKTTAYLNGLASKFHQSIYKNKGESSNRFITFWKFELPLLFKTYQKQLLYAFAFFIVFCLIGALSAKYDDSFVRLIMGDDYIDMTNENIAKGDPFGVYKQGSETLMFLGIAANNIFVSLITFVSGIIFSVGTIYFLFRNGLMLGSFQYYFFSKGLGMQSVLVIWIHGTLEISAIVIAGAAGLVLGNSFLFPKTFKRMVSLKKGAADGMKIAIGLIPIFIVAAFFEGFVTRHTEMPVWLSVGILAASLIFLIWYVILYPNKIYKQTQYATQS
ncbi:stage II sporulation protein M [Mucilaginibacter litoreus]|uniref:Stage II sporulation protein M n=1 Tax=Mucilaginibacter litoreus TaxID=1048221 RepID=A0ABW3AW86_9SPHI